MCIILFLKSFEMKQIYLKYVILMCKIALRKYIWQKPLSILSSRLGRHKSRSRSSSDWCCVLACVCPARRVFLSLFSVFDLLLLSRRLSPRFVSALRLEASPEFVFAAEKVPVLARFSWMLEFSTRVWWWFLLQESDFRVIQEIP